MKKTTNEQIKWQIHAESSITQLMFWIIIAKLFGGWVIGLSVFMILGNLVTFIKSGIKLPKGYFN